jgi:hypothetical protein
MTRAPGKLIGRYAKGFGLATDNLRHCEALIASRIALPSVMPGTFNIALDASFFIKPDAAISAIEYNGWEVVLLQRCTIGGRAAAITRPHTHEIEPKPGELYFGHGLAYVELMAPFEVAHTFGFAHGDQVEIELDGDEAWWTAALDRNWGRRRASGMR